MDKDLAFALVFEEDHPQYDDYEFLVHHEDDGHVKHDFTAYHHIVKNKHTGDLYQIDYCCSYEHGLDEYSIYYNPVVAREVTTIEYILKK